MFSKLSRSNSSSNFSRRSSASTSNTTSANIRQEECQYNDIPEMANFEEQLANWHLPKVRPSEIYSVGFLDFKMAMTIKTIEQTIPVRRDMETIQLLQKEELRRYFDKYKYVHLGMVQVAVKPLTAQGLNKYYKTLFYAHIDCIKQLISFPLWFLDQATRENSPFLHVLKSLHRNWTTAKGETIAAIHPPSELLKLRSGDTIIESAAFSQKKQLNFTNLTLQTICTQLNRIEKNGPIIVPKDTAAIASSSYTPEPTILKPSIDITMSKHPAPSDIITLLTQQLETLNIGNGKNIAVLSDNSDNIEQINNFEKQLLAIDTTPEQQASMSTIYNKIVELTT